MSRSFGDCLTPRLTCFPVFCLKIIGVKTLKHLITGFLIKYLKILQFELSCEPSRKGNNNYNCNRKHVQMNKLYNIFFICLHY